MRRSDEPVLEVRSLSKTFGEIRAVTDISFAVARGEFVALLGPSGCGKTTLLNLIGGFLDPDAGEIRLNGETVNRQPPYRRSTAMVFQSYALFPHLDVFANIAFGLRARHLPRPIIRDRVGRVASILRLGDLLHRYPSQLSGGQQQRVALARALVVEPAILLLDEPLSNLDAKLREEVREEVRDIQRRLSITAILVTHDQDEAMAICDRVMVMHAGRIEQIGTARAIYERPETEFVAEFIGTFNALEGKIVAVQPDGDLFQSSSGLSLRVPHDPDRCIGRKGRLLIRPERLRLTVPTTAETGARAQVEQLTFRGTHIRYMVRAGSARLIVDDPRFETEEFAPGDEVEIVLPKGALFLPRDSQ